MLEVKDAVKIFHRGTVNERPALNGLSLKLETGDFSAVIGSNGAGKSTLLNAIAGGISIDSGTVSVDGHDLTSSPTHKRAKWVARVFQDPLGGTAGPMTIEENLALAALRGQRHSLRLGLNSQRRDYYRDLLKTLGLGLEDRLTAKVELLSGGQRQSLALIMAIITEPAVLLLDEHCAALDPKTAGIVMDSTVKAIEAAGLTTLMVTHNMQHAIEYGNRLIMLEAGQLRLEMSGAEKTSLDVESLVERFHITDDKILLS
ncbi:MAG: ATP-binding cassette domain-containing protein [Rhodospirillaceae bacterium]|nr:ATP-binding cassette domain-containing protein [Rhodospirillaceae bacterium]MBT4588311.1 ATP-binding cassette domain-containing protein [Rhodospirillaceae bacterium]MBT5940080.1 ATP-binding cassette domain-containing protein [Rhodospirillaceae bacterium]MBT7268491.1 ATP-binding cassette domain-containing protein [Rhodospirillaceae bacterium]